MVSYKGKEEGHKYHSSAPLKCSTINSRSCSFPTCIKSHLQQIQAPVAWTGRMFSCSRLLPRAMIRHEHVSWRWQLLQGKWCPPQATLVISAHNLGNSNLLHVPCWKKPQSRGERGEGIPNTKKPVPYPIKHHPSVRTKPDSNINTFWGNLFLQTSKLKCRLYT